MRPILSIVVPVFALCISGFSVGGAQPLTLDTPPEELVRIFIQVIGSPVDTIDRMGFQPRLAGELARADARRFQGNWPMYIDVTIDSVIALQRHPETEERAAIYVRTYHGGKNDDLYFFCRRDSMWKLEALRRFPTHMQQAQITESLKTIDTATATGRTLYKELGRALLTDISLGRLWLGHTSIAEKIAAPLSKGEYWYELPLFEFQFTDLDEYWELDGNIQKREKIFYSLNRNALGELKEFGIKTVKRDIRYPGAVFMEAGNLEGNTYGYIYSAGPGEIPSPSSEEFITVKPVAPKWWLYKKIGQ